MTATITPLGGVAEANAAIFAIVRDHGEALSPAVYDAISAYAPSPVDRIAAAAEALYADMQAAAPGATRDALSTACAQLADFCVANGWHVLGATDRGIKMSGACRRLLGLGEQAAADDPAVGDEFVTTET